MIPQVQDIFNLARFHLGDTAVPGGQIFQDTKLQVVWPNAHNSLYRWLERNCNKLLRCNKYYNVPANTGYLTPAGIGIPNMGKPEELRDRAVALTFNPATVEAINAAALGVPPSVDLTITAHGLSAGAEVVCFGFTGMTDDINDSWYIGVVDANTIRLLGCSSVGTTIGVGATGIVSTGSGQFPRAPLQQLFDYDAEPLSSVNGQLSFWKWMGGAFRFVPATVARQIKITFMLSGTPPTNPTDSVGIDDSLDALSLYLAGAAAAAKGFLPKSESLFMRAVGNPSGETTHIEGGAFYELAQIGLQAVQETRVVLPRYRRKRNVGPSMFSW